MDKRKITLAITTWNRYSETLESFVNVVEDKRINEIVIVDDKSDLQIYRQLETAVSFSKKVKLYRNSENKDCYKNKAHAVSLSSNDWLILLDSDNVIDSTYIDQLYEIKKWDKDTVYQPAWAAPTFDFRAYEGLTVTKHNVAEYFDKPLFSTMCNAMNNFFNRDKFLEVWEHGIDPHTADSILQNYNHLRAGGKIYVVPKMFYTHRIHDGSHYKNNVHKTGNLYNDIEEKIRNLK